MKRALLWFGLVLSAVVMMAATECQGIVSVPWPTETPLTGELPVGRWAGVEDFDFEGKKANNDGDYPALKRVISNTPGGAIELRPGGVGFVLRQYQR